MNKIVSFLSKGMGFTYASVKRLLKNKKTVNNNKILIIATGHIGNAIMDAGAMAYLSKYYQRQGKQVCFLCSNEMRNAFSLVMDLDQITFLSDKYHYVGIATYFSSVKQTLDNLKGWEFERIIVTLTSCDPLVHYVVATTPANESWGVFDDTKCEHGYFRHYFERYYTNKVMVPIDMQEAQRLKLLLEQLGCSGFQTSIQYIPVQMDYPERAPYITVAVDSTSTQRRWVAEKFVALVSRLLEEYPYDVYLTGNQLASDESALYDSAFGEEPRVKNYIGKTGFKEWIEMLRHGQFHIGVDSGSIHVAASVGTQAFCLSGVWDGKRCLPYQIDKRDGRTVGPICIYRSDVVIEEMPCYACQVKKTRIGRGNDECYRECMEGRPCLCLQKIEVDDVVSAIQKNIR